MWTRIRHLSILVGNSLTVYWLTHFYELMESFSSDNGVFRPNLSAASALTGAVLAGTHQGERQSGKPWRRCGVHWKEQEQNHSELWSSLLQEVQNTVQLSDVKKYQIGDAHVTSCPKYSSDSQQSLGTLVMWMSYCFSWPARNDLFFRIPVKIGFSGQYV